MTDRGQRRGGRTLWLLSLAVLAIALAGHRAAVAEDRTLAHLVPADVGLCIQVRELAGHLDRFRATSLYQRVMQFAPLRKFLAENEDALAALADELHQQTGLEPGELLRQLLGQDMLVAIWPGGVEADAPPGPALLMFECADGELLKRVVTRLLDAEQAAGRDVQLERWQHGEISREIHRIDIGLGQPALYLATADRLGIVSTDQSRLKSVLAFAAGADRATSLAAQGEYQGAMARLNPHAAVRAYVSPRAWDPLLTAHLAHLSATPSEAGRRLVDYFRRAESVAISLELGENIVCEAFLQQPAERAGKVVVAANDRGEDLAARLPGDALAAIGGRIDLPRLLSGFFCERPTTEHPTSGSAPTHDRFAAEALGALASSSGHDAIAALVDRRPESPSGDRPTANAEKGDAARALPVDWVVGFDTQALLPDERLSFGERLNPMLRAGLTAAVMMYNRQGQTMAVDSVEEAGVPLTSVSGLALLGQGDSATFSLLHGFYWAGTSREAVRDVARLNAKESLSADPRFQKLTNPRLPNRTHLAYLDLARLRPLLRGKFVATSSPDAASTGDLLDLMSLADRLLVELQIDSAGVGISISATADAPH